MELPIPTRPETTDVVHRATVAALDFTFMRCLPVPSLDVTPLGEPRREGDPWARVQVAFIRDPRELLAWAAAVGAETMRVQARSVDTCAWLHGDVDGVRYSVAASLPHVYGAQHLPGAGVAWDSNREAGITLAQFETGMRGSGYLPVESVQPS